MKNGIVLVEIVNVGVIQYSICQIVDTYILYIAIHSFIPLKVFPHFHRTFPENPIQGSSSKSRVAKRPKPLRVFVVMELYGTNKKPFFGGFNPPEKYARQIGFIFPQIGMNIKKYLSCHHLENLLESIFCGTTRAPLGEFCITASPVSPHHLTEWISWGFHFSEWVGFTWRDLLREI